MKNRVRRVPDKGIGYGLLRFLGDNEALRSELRSQPDAEIVFNYMGQFDASSNDLKLFHSTDISAGMERSPGNRRPYLLEVTAIVNDGRLEITWGYSRNRHRVETIRRIADAFLGTVSAIINLGQEDNGRPSFQLNDTEQAKIQQALEKAAAAFPGGQRS